MKNILKLLSILTVVLTMPFSFGARKIDEQKIREACPAQAAAPIQKQRTILIYSTTKGWNHVEGIAAAKLAFKNMGDKLGTWQTVISDELENLTKENLKKFDCIVLNNTTGMCFGEKPEVLKKMPKAEQEKIIKRSNEICKNLIDYVRNGGSILAVHAGVDCYNRNGFRNLEFTDMLGGEFISHPWCMDNVPVTFEIDDTQSPITKGIWQEDNFKINDEIYMLGESYNRKKCRVLMRINPKKSPITTNQGKKMQHLIRQDGDYATVYIKSFGKGRVAYSTVGHQENNYYDSKHQELYLRLLQFCCGDLKADTTPIEMK